MPTESYNVFLRPKKRIIEVKTASFEGSSLTISID
jgi:hypothetical protein